ncbi:hypothetical protein B7494_g1372 [Chlorociboria aeruginascens]|nr:hypothetical protein B7494_g1372 [Chlorociboria aeruginascens]
MPIFRKQMEDGSEEEISEEELYQYTRHRWIYNEPEQLAARYRKFKISALVDAAVNAAGNSAKSCVKLLKCTEGKYYKVFLLTMDNGAEVVARVPNPNAGPSFYAIASQVATRHFLRAVLNLPVPRIYASSTDPFAVGAEYIIEEKAEGQRLSTLWHQWQPESQLDLLAQLVDFEIKLASVSFRRRGCIYYKKDLEKKCRPVYDPEKNCRPAYDLEKKCRPFYDLEAMSQSSDGPMRRLDPAITEEFALGPSTEPELWNTPLELDRGPWSTHMSFMRAIGMNEIHRAIYSIKPRLNPYRRIGTSETPDDYIRLLEQYVDLAEYLADHLGTNQTMLSHRGLGLDNIFVDPDTKKITCIVDWHATEATPPSFHDSYPQMLMPVRRFLGESGPRADYNLASHYDKVYELKNKSHRAAIMLPRRELLLTPTFRVTNAWGKNEVFYLRQAMIDTAVRWNEIEGPATPFPVTFTQNEIDLHYTEKGIIDLLPNFLLEMHDEGFLPLYGMIAPEYYEKALFNNEFGKKEFIEAATTEKEKVFHSQVWPYQDRDS